MLGFGMKKKKKVKESKATDVEKSLPNVSTETPMPEVKQPVKESISPIIQIKRLPNYEGQPAVEFAHKGDAGIDLRNCNGATIIMLPGKPYTFDTGLAMHIPDGYCGLVMERSGLGKKHGVSVRARVIDSGYRGEVSVILTTESKLKINRGDRVAQIIFVPILRDIEIVETLTDTERGENGFGSTGKK